MKQTNEIFVYRTLSECKYNDIMKHCLSEATTNQLFAALREREPDLKIAKLCFDMLNIPYEIELDLNCFDLVVYNGDSNLMCSFDSKGKLKG